MSHIIQAYDELDPNGSVIINLKELMYEENPSDCNIMDGDSELRATSWLQVYYYRKTNQTKLEYYQCGSYDYGEGENRKYADKHYLQFPVFPVNDSLALFVGNYPDEYYDYPEKQKDPMHSKEDYYIRISKRIKHIVIASSAYTGSYKVPGDVIENVTSLNLKHLIKNTMDESSTNKPTKRTYDEVVSAYDAKRTRYGQTVTETETMKDEELPHMTRVQLQVKRYREDIELVAAALQKKVDELDFLVNQRGDSRFLIHVGHYINLYDSSIIFPGAVKQVIDVPKPGYIKFEYDDSVKGFTDYIITIYKDNAWYAKMSRRHTHFGKEADLFYVKDEPEKDEPKKDEPKKDEPEKVFVAVTAD